MHETRLCGIWYGGTFGVCGNCGGAIVVLVTGSLMGDVEIREYLSPVLTGAKGYASWRLFPAYPTLKNAVELLLDSPEFFQHAI